MSNSIASAHRPWPCRQREGSPGCLWLDLRMELTAPGYVGSGGAP
jgi:hypothetical protein